VLWEDNNGWKSNVNNGVITLNDSYKNYDFIAFNVSIPQESPTSSSPILNNFVVSRKAIEDSTVGKFALVGYGTRSLHFVIISDTSLQCTVNESNMTAYKIYGIKFSKNLSEQMYSNVLYENASGWSSGNITLNDSLDNYDFITFYYRGTSDTTHMLNMIFNADTLYNRVGQYIDITGYDNRYFNFLIYSKTQLNYDSRNVYAIYKITGHKMAKGGYSGIVSDARMTVKSGTIEFDSIISASSGSSKSVIFDSPMPDTNYHVGLTRNFGGAEWNCIDARVSDKTVNGFTIYVYNSVNRATANKPNYTWVAIRPNSYTREGMIEDVLFSDASGVNTGTINLSGNISDYDLIQFETNLKGYNNLLNENTTTYLTSKLITLDGTTTNSNCILLNSFDNKYLKLSYTNDNTFSVIENGGVAVTRIVGIKFGRYVSGVAVDTTVTQNSDAVITSGAVYDALQNIPSGGGGSSITVDSTITQGGTNPVEGGAIYTALGDKADKSTTYTKTEVDTALVSKGDVTTDTAQNITGTKTFVGSKKVAFKQSTTNDKLGFTLYGNTGTERGYLEFNPTNTIDGVAGLMTLGNYATNAGALTHVGFRRYSNISGANGAYNLLTPLIADAKTPFSLTTSYTNFYLPLGFTDGTTTVRTAKSGLVDLSPLLASLEARIAALEGN